MESNYWGPGSLKKKLYIGLVWVDYWIYVFFMLLRRIVCLSEAEMFGLSRMFGVPGERVFGVGSNWIRAFVPDVEPDTPDKLVELPDELVIPNKLAEPEFPVRPVILDAPMEAVVPAVLVEPWLKTLTGLAAVLNVLIDTVFWFRPTFETGALLNTSACILLLLFKEFSDCELPPKTLLVIPSLPILFMDTSCKDNVWDC